MKKFKSIWFITIITKLWLECDKQQMLLYLLFKRGAIEKCEFKRRMNDNDFEKLECETYLPSWISNLLRKRSRLLRKYYRMGWC